MILDDKIEIKTASFCPLSLDVSRLIPSCPVSYLLSGAVSSCSAEGHVPTSCNPSNCLWVLLQSCILFSPDNNQPWASTRPAPQYTEYSYIGSVSLDHINSTLNVTTDSLDLTSPPGRRRDRRLYSLRPKTPRSESGVYLYFFDVWGWDVAGFPRAAAGPQPPVFVAPLQD